MADEFDPYSQLLGIPPEDSSGGGPNHYRLLGLPLFESQRATIDAAAKRLMAQLQKNATGADPASVRRLLGEISNARVCLLTPDKRSAYDERLKAELESAKAMEMDIEVIDEPELTGSGVGHGDGSREAGAGQGGGGAQPANSPRPTAPSSSAPAGGHGGGFFADLGLGSGIGSSAQASSDSTPPGGVKASAAAAGRGQGMAARAAPGKNKASAGTKSAASRPGTGAAKAKPAAASPGRTGAAAKKQGWKLQPWQIVAICAGGFLFVVVVGFIIVEMNNDVDDDRQVKVVREPSTPKFGPGSFTGTIDDVTTRSPLGTRPSAKVQAQRHGDLLLADVKINGKDLGTFLLDTGSTDVLISPKWADKLKLAEAGRTSVQGPGGKHSASKRRIKTLTLGDTPQDAVTFEDKNMLPERAGNWNVLAVDLKPWQDAIGLPIAGVLGCDIWYQMPVQWNVADQSITFYNRHQNVVAQSSRAEFMTLINAAASVGQPCATVSLDHGKAEDYWLLATGAPTDVLIRGKKPGGEVAKVGSLNVFGSDFANPSSAALTVDSAYYVDDTRQKGVIGSHILANFILVLDFQNNKYLAQRNADK